MLFRPKLLGFLFLLCFSICFLSGCIGSADGDVITGPSGTGYIPVLKYHNPGPIDTTQADVWTNISWNLSIPSETTYGFTLQTDNVTFVTSFDGLVVVGGCGHFVNNQGAALNTRIGIRVLIDGDEARCEQASDQFTRQDGEVSALRYDGTINVSVGSEIVVQYYVGDVDADLEGDSIFDNPVAASVFMIKVSES